jgi:hypothetical protein
MRGPRFRRRDFRGLGPTGAELIGVKLGAVAPFLQLPA